MKTKESNVTCPKCGYSSLVKMPEDYCVLLYHCPECQAALRPQKGDCCIFCTYGAVKCPPMQE